MSAEPIDFTAVKAKHAATPVYEYDDVNGVFVYGDNDERVLVRQLCAVCSLDSTIEALGECEWTEDHEGSVDWPCDAYRLALEVERLADERDALVAADERAAQYLADAAQQVERLAGKVARVQTRVDYWRPCSFVVRISEIDADLADQPEQPQHPCCDARHPHYGQVEP